MAELNRQVLINLHSDANTPSAEILLHGELAVMHSNITAATIYTKTTDGQVAKFITDKAVDAKIKPVADDLAAHKTAYGVKMTELENADAANAAAISAETEARKSADQGLDTRLTKVETLLGDTDTEGSILDRLADVEAVASGNTAAIAEEARVRAEEDGKINTELENHDTRITAAKNQADKGVADAAAALAHSQGVAGDLTTTAAAIRKEFADADAALMGKDTDAAGDATIKGALKAAAAAQTAADAAQDYAEGVAANLTKEIERATSAETVLNAAITAETAAREAADAGLLGASGDAASAVTIWGAKNAAAAAQESADDANDAVEALNAETVKAGEIVGVGAEGKSTIVGTFANNKLTFDFGQLVIDCGTF